MMVDIVIDTNVLVHAGAPSEPRMAEAFDLVRRLIAVETLLCVDNGFDADRDRNRSLIAAEYYGKLRYGSPGLGLLAHLAQNHRLRFLPRMAERSQQRKINQMIRKPRDKTFLSVASNSTERVLVSHDFEDFQAKKRPDIKKYLGVAVICASECRLD
jgi:hypothetical protein